MLGVTIQSCSMAIANQVVSVSYKHMTAAIAAGLTPCGLDVLFPSIVSKTPTCLGFHIVSACWRSEPGEDGYLALAGRPVINITTLPQSDASMYISTTSLLNLSTRIPLALVSLVALVGKLTCKAGARS